MKNQSLKFICFLLFCFASFSTISQNAPSLRVTNDSAGSVQIQWPSEVGTSYRLLFTESLAPFSLWSPLQDVLATGTNSTLSISATETPTGFFKMLVLDNATGFPTARIISPTNGGTVSGTITIQVGAQDDSQLVTVSLYLDGEQIAFIEAGDLKFNLDTSHFTNGTHALYAVARDNSENATQSSTIAVDFQNSVRWLDADTLFTDQLPMQIESDIFPADWTIFVEDMAGNPVRTFSGSTTDGLIETNWDGLDDNGIAVPAEAGYRVTIIVNSQNSAFQSFANEIRFASAQTPSIEDTDQQLADPVQLYYDTFGSLLSSPEKDNFPPIPPIPMNNAAAMKKPLTPRERFVAQSQSIALSGAGASASSSAIIWYEAGWQSGNILLSRQKITGTTGLIWDGTTASLLSAIKNAVAGAANDLPSNNHRDVYQNTVFVMQNSGNYSTLTNNLKTSNPDIRAFYFYGHGNTDGNVIGGIIRSHDLAQTLGNVFYYAHVGGPGYPYAFQKPFNFVFLDGCMTGNGNFPEAFGIPKTRGQRFYQKNPSVHARAFMGWGAKVSDSILNHNSIDWSQTFWTTWLEHPDQNTILDGVRAADLAHPLPQNLPLRIYGTPLLKWAD